jgi:3' terminal RNA ribose 2'-O-methyltransferase Hen1
MLLTVSTTYQPATDLGYLLHKNPARVQTEELTFGKAHVFYPDADDNLCTAALLVDVDPIGLVRGRGPAGEGRQFEQYVNDRPYAANSFLSVAMGRVFASALGGRSKDRPELAETAIPLRANLPVLRARGGEDLVRRLFEPLGYTIEVENGLLDEQFPEWGTTPYISLTLAATTKLKDLLTHIYVLVPVLDNDKHYFVSTDEIEKLLRRGEGWLPQHPEKDLIVSRYLKRQAALTRVALERLLIDEPEREEATLDEAPPEDVTEARPGAHAQRLERVLEHLRQTGAKRVLDLGCGEGRLLRLLLAEKQFEFITGMDVSWRALEIARERLQLDRMNERQRGRVELVQGSLVYRDTRLEGFDAAAVVEVIEHLDGARLAAFERNLFEFARPTHVVLTTPNAEYNAVFPTLAEGRFRHLDHRFEWTRTEFNSWATGVAGRFGYSVEFEGVGPEDPRHGHLSQIAVFSRTETATA